MSYFQRYILSKGVALPVDVDYMLADTLEKVCPKLKWPSSYQEACEAVEKSEKQDDDGKKRTLLPSNEKMWPVTRPDGEEYEESDEEDEQPEEELPGAEDDGGAGAPGTAEETGGTNEEQDEEDDEKDAEENVEDDKDYSRGDDPEVRAFNQEALEIDREFQKIIQESVKQRKNDPRASKIKSLSQPLNQIIKNSPALSKR